MKITQLRNATIIVQAGAHHILVDPMLAPAGALPPLGLFNGRRLRNPLVELPPAADAALDQVTHCLITHCQRGHFDHLDRAGARWLRERQVPVICTPHDAPFLRKRGLNVQPLPDGHEAPSDFLGGRIRTVRCTHGEGWIGRVMEHGVGYLIELPGEPTLYLAGDTVLTERVRAFVELHQPALCVLPAGGASMDAGGDIIMDANQVIALARLSSGVVVANHLEALGHCPVTRAELALAIDCAGLGARMRVPADGESVELFA